jgi:hypothetical protein
MPVGLNVIANSVLLAVIVHALDDELQQSSLLAGTSAAHTRVGVRHDLGQIVSADEPPLPGPPSGG